MLPPQTWGSSQLSSLPSASDPSWGLTLPEARQAQDWPTQRTPPRSKAASCSNHGDPGFSHPSTYLPHAACVPPGPRCGETTQDCPKDLMRPRTCTFQQGLALQLSPWVLGSGLFWEMVVDGALVGGEVGGGRVCLYPGPASQSPWFSHLHLCAPVTCRRVRMMSRRAAPAPARAGDAQE